MCVSQDVREFYTTALSQDTTAEYGFLCQITDMTLSSHNVLSASLNKTFPLSSHKYFWLKLFKLFKIMCCHSCLISLYYVWICCVFPREKKIYCILEEKKLIVMTSLLLWQNKKVRFVKQQQYCLFLRCVI